MKHFRMKDVIHDIRFGQAHLPSFTDGCGTDIKSDIK